MRGAIHRHAHRTIERTRARNATARASRCENRIEALA
jgi:hypothetical protein